MILNLYSNSRPLVRTHQINLYNPASQVVLDLYQVLDRRALFRMKLNLGACVASFEPPMSSRQKKKSVFLAYSSEQEMPHCCPNLPQQSVISRHFLCVDSKAPHLRHKHVLVQHWDQRACSVRTSHAPILSSFFSLSALAVQHSRYIATDKATKDTKSTMSIKCTWAYTSAEE